MVKLQSSNIKPLTTQQMSSFMGGRREIEDSYNSALKTIKSLMKDGFNPILHKLTNGRYCIEW